MNEERLPESTEAQSVAFMEMRPYVAERSRRALGELLDYGTERWLRNPWGIAKRENHLGPEGARLLEFAVCLYDRSAPGFSAR